MQILRRVEGIAYDDVARQWYRPPLEVDRALEALAAAAAAAPHA